MRAEHEVARQRGFELANLISYAFHEPKNMPSYNDSRPKEPQENVTDEVALAQVRGFFMAMASRSS